MSVSEKIRREVCDRENVFNPAGHDYHHCFFKSEWFFDVDGEWNGYPSPRYEHTCIHSPGTEKEVLFGHKMEILRKKEAFKRFKEQYPTKIDLIAKLWKIIERKEKRHRNIGMSGSKEIL